MFSKKKTTEKVEASTGIDVGDFAVKVVQISKKEDVVTLDAFGYSKIGETRREGVVEAIKEACQKAGLTYKRVNASINPEGVIIRYLMLPDMAEEDLKNAMKFEIQRYVPFDEKETVSDYVILNKKADSKNMKILLVAAKKANLERRVKILTDAGLEPDVMTIDSIVLKNPFLLNYPEKNSKTIGLLNIGSKISNINIIRESVSHFMRDVQLGGDSITQLLKEKLEIDLEKAEEVKCQLSVSDKDKFKIIEPVLGNLLNEVYLSFDYYESEFGMAVDEIFISGGTARLAWLSDFLKENLSREISVLNSTQKLFLSSSIKKEELESLRPSLAVALGLALESFS